MSMTYEQHLQSLLDGMQAAERSGTCNAAVIDDIVDWVTRRDPDASQKFNDAVRRGTPAYQALQDRLGHDQNALRLVQRCEVEARQSLAARGYT
jgi:hypothetical protein